MRENRHTRYAFFTVMLLSILSALILFIYTNSESSTPSSDPMVRIVFIPKVIDERNDFWTTMLEGAQMATTDKNIELTFLGTDSEMFIDEQNELIEEAIAMQPNAIALAPCDYERTLPYAKKIEEMGIKLIIIDSVMAEEVGVSVVATDNFVGGERMGSYMKDKIDSNAVIGIVGHVKGSSTATEREAGLREGLGMYEKNIVNVVFCDSSFDKAYEVTKQMLETYPDMNVIFGLNEYSAVGAARAVKDMGLTEQISMVGFDSSMEEVQLLEEGVFDAIVVQKPVNMGYLGVTMAYQAALNQEISASIDSGSVLITKDTIYTDENQKLLFPFKEQK